MRRKSVRSPVSRSTSTEGALTCVGRPRGDQVGHEDGVVEAVERKVGAGGEHADDAAQHRPHERAAGDGHTRRARGAGRGRLGPGHAASITGANDIATRLPRESGP